MNDLSEAQQKYWDSVADAKNFPTRFQIDQFKQYVSKDMSVLDVGCGYGRTLAELAAHGFTSLTGVDTSQKMIDRGKAEHPELKLLKVTPGRLPFEDSSFDAALLVAVLTCIPQKHTQQTLLAEITRILKPDGILYINEYMLNNDPRNIARYEKYQPKHGDYGIFELPEGAILRHHSKEYLLELTKDFQMLKFQPVTYPTMNGNKSKGCYCIAKKK